MLVHVERPVVCKTQAGWAEMHPDARETKQGALNLQNHKERKGMGEDDTGKLSEGKHVLFS